MGRDYIASRVAIAHTGMHLVLADVTGLIQIKLDRPETSSVVFGAVRAGVDTMAVVFGGCLIKLRTTLDDVGFLTCDSEPDPNPALGMSLADGLRLARNTMSLPSTLIFTADEAFWPGTADPLTTRCALRMFVSRLSDAGRTGLYGAFFSDPAIEICGDRPDAEACAAAARTVRQDPDVPQVVDLRTGEVSGRLPTVGAIWRSDAGRLGVAAVTRNHMLTGKANRSVHWANGYAAFPNLSMLPRPGDAALARVDYPRISGVDASRELASIKCHAEGVERFASGDVDVSGLLRCSASELDGQWLDPTTVIAYNQAQIRRLGVHQFEPDTPNWWVLGRTLEGPVWIPAPLVYYPFADPPSWLHPSAVSSNGVAAFSDANGARYRAWAELVERDAFQRARLLGCRSGATRWPEAQFPKAANDILSSLARLGTLTVLRLPSPTCLPVTLVRLDNDDGVALGMSAAKDATETLTKAATEAYVQAVHPFTHDVEVTVVDTPGDHAVLYRQLDWRARLDWMLAAPTLDHELVQYGAPIAFPRTAHWVELHQDADLTVVRVVDPALIPITFGYDSDPTGRPDFAELSRMAGLNLDQPIAPHPFA